MKLTRILSVALAALSILASPGCAQDKEPSSGARLYLQYCAGCHGSNLKGGSGSNLLDNEWRVGGSTAQIYETIFTGIPSVGMPNFGAQLGEEKVREIVSYIEQVRATGDTGAPAKPVRSYSKLENLDYNVNVDVWVDGLNDPWGLAFLDERRAIVTEKNGPVRLILDGKLVPEAIEGTPKVVADGQGGMLDVTIDPNFADNGWIYLGYSHQLSNGKAMTRIVRGQLDGMKWINEQVVFEAPPATYMDTRHHYGTRIVFGPDGMLYFSIGERGRQQNAQVVNLPNGKIHRVTPDGKIPEDNPFVATPGAIPSIWSFGHRNPQGLAFNPVTGDLWESEHGPRGGDELNIVGKGKNYGWPEITYGINYNGSIVTRERVREGLEQPILYWRPSIAVSGIEFYTGDEFPYWKNHLLVSSLAFQELHLLHIENDRVIHEEVLMKGRGRIRESIVGPDGAIYCVMNDPHEILRLSSGGERRY
ncbi:hypothetical protein GC173_03875 [bacterium]|nr:hypothetical protein [bacterium]